jgi:cbb3-type cytochrome oxidase maturation protein
MEDALMEMIVLLLPLSLSLASLFAWLFVRAARDGQFDDLDDPPVRILDE